MIYLDSAATALKKPPGVIYAMKRAMDTASSPGRGGHGYAMRAAEIVYDARELAARLFNAPDPENVVFTFNATHGLNIAINSILPEGGKALISGWEHNSVFRPLKAKNADISVAEAPMDGEKTVEAFRRGLQNRPDVCVINHVSNVTGFILPIYEISKLCRDAGVPFIIDASQSAGAVKIDYSALGADFIAMPGHKGLYGPQGTGILLCRDKGAPILYGGSGSSSALPDMPEHLPDRLEAGTLNTAGIAGLAAGMHFVLNRGTKNVLRREQSLISRAADGLSRIKGIRLYLPEKRERAGVLSFNYTGTEPERAGEFFSRHGVALRCGLHCAPVAHKTLGTFPNGTVRLSVSDFTTEKEIDEFLKTAGSFAAEIRRAK